MRTPSWHRDTYVEDYHRSFFTRYAKGKPLLKCGIKDEHNGGLATVPALLTALPEGDHRQTIQSHVTRTHRHSNVLRASDCLTRLLNLIAQGGPLREALIQAAGDWFSTRKANEWAPRPNRVTIRQKPSPACYIDQSFPASLYLAWKYNDDLKADVIANEKVSDDNYH